MSSRWLKLARQELVDRRNQSGAWGYSRNTSESVEPTALAILALIAANDSSSSKAEMAYPHDAGLWLASIQQKGGDLPASLVVSTSGWATPYALLAWNGLGGFEIQRRNACNWLLGTAGQSVVPSIEDRAVVGHDLSLIGWPWVEGTHSWLEPTALAVLALRKQGYRDHPRVREGIKLILNRSISSGGWNYGNSSVFGQVLRAQPGPTGIALLALAACGESNPTVTDAIEYLLRTLPSIRAAISLGWGLLALRVYDAIPKTAESWLGEAFALWECQPRSTNGLALLLLASGALDLTLFDSKVLRESSSHSESTT